MKIKFSLNNLGVRLSYDDEPVLKPSKDADQKKPRRYYVYAHKDLDGKTFYIGKGRGGRAWSKDRHSIWVFYVENHLNSKYEVEILDDDLSEVEAEELEAQWISHYGSELVNWVNMSRETDFKKLKLFHKLRDENKSRIKEARELEIDNIEEAIQLYNAAIESADEYTSIEYEGGLVGQLLKEQSDVEGKYGELMAMDRLSICLIKLNRVEEAADISRVYFERYKGDLQRSACKRINKRIVNAQSKQ